MLQTRYFYIGPPAALEVVYFGTNNSVFFYSYSHPDQYSSVTVFINNYETDTGHRCAVDQTLGNGSEYLSIHDVCNDIGTCTTLHVSGIVSNALGNSEEGTSEILIYQTSSYISACALIKTTAYILMPSAQSLSSFGLRQKIIIVMHAWCSTGYEL